LNEPVVAAAAHYHVIHRWAPTIALEKGFFAEEGLDNVKVITTDHDEEKFWQEAKAGRVHFGVDAKPRDVVRWVLNDNADLVFIGGWRNQSPWYFFGTKGMTSLQDVRGKRVGIRDTGGVNEVQTRIWFEKAGIDPDRDVQIVRGLYYGRYASDALRRGEVDCVPVSTELAEELEAEGYPLLIRLGREIYPDGYPERAVVTTRRLIEQQPETVVKFLKGIIRGYRTIRDQPKNHEYILDLDRRMRARDEDPEERAIDMQFTPESRAALPYPPDGSLPLGGLRTIIDQEKEGGRVPKDFQAESLVRSEFVDRANRELAARPELADELARVAKWVEKYGA
jgi:ABC-type nitrate/sulfonate/bicarbonate transport system substrate-binding protein